MANTHETIADIIAWLRRPREGENAYLTLWRDEIADRIEAAHKRELSKNTSKNGADFGQLGDAAKLREAVERSIDEMQSAVFEIDFGSDMAIIIACIKQAIEKCKTALAAPPRNCDNLKTSWEVLKEWHGGLDTANDIVRLLDWLLSPATEKEGGNDADK